MSSRGLPLVPGKTLESENWSLMIFPFGTPALTLESCPCSGLGISGSESLGKVSCAKIAEVRGKGDCGEAGENLRKTSRSERDLSTGVEEEVKCFTI